MTAKGKGTMSRKGDERKEADDGTQGKIFKMTIEAARDKLSEARFFLNHMKDAPRIMPSEPMAFLYYKSAFANAGLSVREQAVRNLTFSLDGSWNQELAKNARAKSIWGFWYDERRREFHHRRTETTATPKLVAKRVSGESALHAAYIAMGMLMDQWEEIEEHYSVGTDPQPIIELAQEYVDLLERYLSNVQAQIDKTKGAT